MMPVRFPGRRRRLALIATAAAALIALAGCAAQGGASGEATPSKAASDAVGDTMTIQFLSAPISLDPAKTGIGPGQVFVDLAYEPLIFKDPQGEYQPDLATEWGYQDDTNQVFELTLRDGVTFADGTPIDNEAVAGSIRYFKDAKGPQAIDLAALDAIDTSTPGKVLLTFSKPTPNLERVFSQVGLAGQIISPAGIADPKSLESGTAGAGQYILNKSTTVIGEKYVFDANPNYWNKDAQHWKTVVVQSIAEPNAILSAARTGQIDVALTGSSATADAAKSAGLEVLDAPYVWSGLLLLDRAGELVPALGDERVRQAINYAIDRESIQKAVIGKYGEASDQVLTPETDGHLDSTTYDYDLAKAESLMTEAGYEDGFDLVVSDTTLLDPNTTLGQAIASALAKINITVTIENAPTIQQFRGDLTNKKYAATVWSPLGGIGMGQFAGTYMTPNTTFNPFGSTDEELNAHLAEADAASGEARTKALESAQQRVLDLAWFAPVYWQQGLLYVGDRVTNVEVSPLNNLPNPVAPTAEGGWKPTASE
jgi:peptide/nickel transport system substrate-binding protein